MQPDLSQAFRNRHVLITGGLGFIGSNLAIRLADLGARVTILDAMIPDYGGNLFNIKPAEDRIVVNFGDIRDTAAVNWLVRGKDFVFHLAGQVCHIMSLVDPFPDIDINIKGTAIVMEALKKYNPGARLIYSGTRGQYGASVKLPVDEEAATNPKGIYEISRLAAEKIVKVYNDVHGVPSVLLRLTNTYGPRSQMKHSRFGVANWFVRLAIDNETIKVFGDGKILRDFLYVDDCVDAMLLAAVHPAAVGHIFNVGVDQPSNFFELTQTILRVSGSGRWEYAPFSAERKAQEPGDFYTDITKIKSLLGWAPRTSLEDGLRETIAFYRQHRARYWGNE